MRTLSLLVSLLFACTLGAQLRQSVAVEWRDNARTLKLEAGNFLQFGYRASFAGGADAGAWVWSEEPRIVNTFPAGPGRSYRVTLSNVVTRAVAERTDYDYPTSFDFVYTSSRQPEGYVGKVSGPALIRTEAGLQQLVSATLDLTPADNSVGAARMVFAENSVLREGTWFRVAVEQTGIHKLTREYLTGIGVNLDGVDPRSIAVYGQAGSGKLPETINVAPPDDLTELPVLLTGEGDGSFDGGDALYFYAAGPDEWTHDANQDRFFYEKNIYSRRNYYFLRIGGAAGRRIGELPAPSPAGAVTVEDYDALYHFEEDKFNLLHQLGGNSHGSGQNWFGDLYANAREGNYGGLFNIPALVPGQSTRVRASAGLRADATSSYQLEIDGQTLRSANAPSVRIGLQEQSQALRVTELSGTVTLQDGSVDVLFQYPLPAGANTSEAYLDWIQLRARRQLSFTGLEQFPFRNVATRNAASVRYQFAAPPADAEVWSIDGADWRRAALNNSSILASAGGELREFVAFRRDAALLSPVAAVRLDNQNLHATDAREMLIITHPDFLNQAERLAEHRREFSGLSVELVTTRQIYNEFSSGRDDPAAIRNYVRMVYERAPELRYVLLFGDGSFDHRNVLELGTAFIPTYQHSGAFTEVNSYPADDFFGILSPAQNGQPLEPDLSVAVGRLPVKTSDEAVQVVEKIIRYDSSPEALGDWRTRMTFVGDDEDNGIHTRDVDTVANRVGRRKPDLNFDKLYFDLFPQQSLSAGDRFPAVTEGLDRSVFRGALTVTYLGHGGPRGWAQERVLTIPQIRNWRKNPGAIDPIQPPVFITATCTFSNYDDAAFVSAGEEALLTPNGGVAALLTTTRPVFATQNFNLTNFTIQAMLDRPDGNWRTLGDVIRIAKNQITSPTGDSRLARSTENARKFTLLGDPAMTIALPEHNVRTTMVDGRPLDTARTDTVRALQQMSISGEVTDVNGNLLENFNGTVFPTIYDKPQTVTTLQQDLGSPRIPVQVQRNIVFRGRATVTNGRFTFTFVVPQDINYAFGAGKISYYAADPEQQTDASGAYSGLIIGGTATNVVADDEGPTVEVFMDDEDFVSGGEVDADPTLLVKLSDDLGINVTGNSIGHDLEAVIDEDTRNPIVLNDYYEATTDDFRSGTVRYPLFDLEPGLHTISVRAWDVANNPATGRTEFLVAADGNDAITHILNYPNPFTTNTCFQFDHTLVGEEVQAIVQVYTVSGRLVKTLTKDLPFSDGTVRRDDCLPWDGLDDYGDQLARGTYLYQVRLRGSSGTTVNGELQKLVILR